MQAPVRVTMLGELAVDGTPLPGARLATLARTLLRAQGRAVPGTDLVDELWDGDAPADPRGALQALASRLRRTGLRVEAVGSGYRVVLDGVEVDLLQAREALDAAREADASGDHATAARLADQGLALWSAPAEPDLHTALVMLRTRAELAAGAQPMGLDQLRAAVEARPTDEPLVAVLMRALAATGRQAEALERFETLRSTLAERFGTDPAPVVSDVHVALLRGELSPPPGPDTAPTADAAGDRPADPARPARRPTPPWRRPATPLLGRDADLDRLQDSVATSPLVTLVAVGGAGKTRLAYELARRAEERGEPVWVLELAHVRGPDQVLPALLTLTGTAESEVADDSLTVRVRDVADRVAGAAAALDGLLVVDNCEHVLDAAAELVGGLLDAAGDRLHVVATSRAPLGLPLEVVHDVSALPDDVALALLRDRSRAARADVVWDDAVAGELCRRLDNLPLAIELAAARTRSMPVTEILAGVEHRFALLDHAVRGLPDRHQGLWAMVDWSWALLTEAQQDLLVRLAVVPAPFGAELAVALADGSPRARMDLAALVEQSLVQLGDGADGVSYRLLETVREYGEARLADRGERAHALDRLTAWAAGLARALMPDLVGPRQVETFTTVTRETETLTTALRWAAAHGAEHESFPVACVLLTVWTSRGLHAEAARWAAIVMCADRPELRRGSWALHGAHADDDRAADGPADRPRPTPDEVAETALRCLINGASAGAMRTAALGLRAVRRVRAEHGDQLGPRARALADAMLSAGSINRDPEAWAVAAGAHMIASGDPQVTGLGLFLRGALAENAGEPWSGAEDAMAAYRSFKAAGDQWGMGVAAQLVSRMCSARAEHDEALHWLGVAEHHLRMISALEDLTQVQVMHAVSRVLAGDREAEHTLTALATDPERETTSRAQAALGLAAGLAVSGREGEAAAWSARALTSMVTDGGAFAQARVLFRVVDALIRLRRGDDVRPALDAAVPDALEARDAPVLGTLALGFAEVAAADGDLTASAELTGLAARVGGSLTWFIGRAAAEGLLPHSLAVGPVRRSGLTSQEAIARIIEIVAPGTEPGRVGWSAL